jgi:succinylglutamate desuccinylase
MTVDLKNEVLKRTIKVRRLIGSVEQDANGPTIVFTAGIHGNESAGVFALHDAFEELQNRKIKFNGSIYAIAGNLQALAQNKRFINQDLNRIWQLAAIQKNSNSSQEESVELNEQQELLSIFERILKSHNGPFIFVDLHTTSARTVPYITINDTLENRKLSFKYPLPVILGIESFIEGPMLSFINEMGHKAIGFEAGQHDQQHTYNNHKSFFWLSLVNSGVISKKYLPEFDEIFDRLLIAAQGHKQVYEVCQRYDVTQGDNFEMIPGYSNFQYVQKGQYLAETNNGNVLCQESGHIFMPRYEEQGTEGFYIVKKVTKSWLNLSAAMRKLNIDNCLVYLPGVSKKPDTEGAIVVNPTVARFFTAEIFHLLGYRRKMKDNGVMVFSKREMHIKS